MSLISRLKDLVRANVNDIVTKAEDPEKSLNLYIEDATEHLREFGVEVNRVEAGRIMIERQIQESQAAIEEWHKQAKMALGQNREDLARKALEREQHERENVEKLTAELKSVEESAAQLKAQHQKLQERLAEAKEKRDDLVRRNRIALAQQSATQSMASLSTDDPLSKFDRMEEKVGRREAEAQASYSTLNSSLSYEMADLKKMATEMKVDDALDKLKEEVGNKDS